MRVRVAAPNADGWGVPNWERSDDYPDLKSTTWLAWAWEFLRRNSDYRREWMRSIYPFLGPAPDRDGLNPSTFDYRAHEAAVRDGHAEPLNFGLRFGLEFDEDPRQTSNLGFPLPGFRYHDEGEQRLTIGPDEVAMIFHLTAPIGPQVKRAAYVLNSVAARKNAGKRITQPKPRDLVLKLRCIDAYDAGASTRDRVERLSPRPRIDTGHWLDDATSDAEKWTSEKYSCLLAWYVPALRQSEISRG